MLIHKTAMLDPKDVVMAQKKFTESFLTMSDGEGDGIASHDASMEFKALSLNPTIVTPEQQKLIEERIKIYFGVNDEILLSKFSEDNWISFFESKIEPFFVALSLETTKKLFTIF